MFSVREGDGAVDGRGSTGGSHQTAVGGGGDTRPEVTQADAGPLRLGYFPPLSQYPFPT